MFNFLLVSFWNRLYQGSIFNRFRDIRPQISCAHTRAGSDFTFCRVQCRHMYYIWRTIWADNSRKDRFGAAWTHWIWMISRQGPWLGITPTGCAVMVQRDRWLVNNAKEPDDTTEAEIPVFHCPDAVRLSVVLCVRSHSNQLLLICIGAARRSGRQDLVLPLGHSESCRPTWRLDVEPYVRLSSRDSTCNCWSYCSEGVGPWGVWSRGGYIAILLPETRYPGTRSITRRIPG